MRACIYVYHNDIASGGETAAHDAEGNAQNNSKTDIPAVFLALKHRGKHHGRQKLVAAGYGCIRAFADRPDSGLHPRVGVSGTI